MDIKQIADEWRKFKEGKDEGWIYDEGYTFFDNMRRGDIVTLLDWVSAQNPN